MYREDDWAMTKRFIGLMAIATVVAVSAAVLGSGQVRAATIVVTTLADENDTNPAACSLREAIAAAGSDTPVDGCQAGASADAIVFGISGTIALDPNLGPLSVGGGLLMIAGPGGDALRIDGGGAVQLMRVPASAELTVAGLTFENGRAQVGGALLNEGSVTVTGSDFRSNQAISAAPIDVAGGAIFNTGNLTIGSSTFSSNRAIRSPQTSADGGAIFSSGTLAITNSTFSGNRADQDGGVISNTGSLIVTDSSFSSNTALFAGAIMHWSGGLTVTGSTFSGNSATFDSGAIKAFASLAITNSTFNGNDSDRGGAIFAAGGTIAVTSSTFGGNRSGTGVLLQEGSATFTLHNVVFANPAPSCAGDGQYTDLGGNISADASCPFTQPSSRSNTDPLLGPLQHNGGPTETIALPPGSPAIDAAVGCPPPNTDQRGVTRPQGAACDSGAYELGAVSVTLTGAKTCTRTSATTADCVLALTINPPTSGTNTLTVTTDTGSFGAVTAAGSPATCSPGVVSATGPTTVILALPAGCSGVTLSETLRDLPVGTTTVTQTATLAGPGNATGAFTATLGTAPPPMEEILGFRHAAGLRMTCPPVAAVRQIVTCTVVPVDAAGNTVSTAPGVIEVSSLAGGLVTARGTRSTNLRIPCGGPVQASPTSGTPIDPNTCRGVTFQLGSTAVGPVEVRARYEPDSAPAAAGIGELETVATVTFVAG